MSKYEADSPPALALAQQVDRTKARFNIAVQNYYVERMDLIWIAGGR
jgi:hypothetical protein